MAASPRSSEFEVSDRKLRRELSLQQLFFISFGAIIGSGWLFAVLKANAVAGPAVVFAWVIAGILIIFVALNYAETSCMLPRSGAVVRYPHLSHGGFLGFMVSWSFLVATVTVPAIEAEAVIEYASSYLPGLTKVASVYDVIAGAPQKVNVLTGTGIILAVALMVFFFLINLFGVRFFGRFNQVITWWKFIIPVITFILLFFLFKGSNFTSYGGFAPLGWSNVFLAIATSGIVFAYLGFRQGLDFGGEAKNPQRDIPLATVLSVAAAGTIYILLQIGFTGAIDWAKVGIHPGNWLGLAGSNWANAPLREALGTSGIGALAAFSYVLLFDSFVSPSGTGWIYIGAATRVFYGMGMHGDLPRPFTWVSERFRIPWVALIAALVVGCLFFAPLPSWYLLVNFISSATALTFIMGGLQVTVMRRTARNLPRPFVLPAAWLFAPLGFLAATMIMYWSGFGTLTRVIAAVFIGLCLYTWFHARNEGWMRQGPALALGLAFLVVFFVTQYFGPINKNTLPFVLFWALISAEIVAYALAAYFLSNAEGRRAVNAGWWFLFLTLGLYLLSYFGAYSVFKHAPIPFPWDNLIAIAIGLVAYYWGVASGYQTEEMRRIDESGTGIVPEEGPELNLPKEG